MSSPIYYNNFCYIPEVTHKIEELKEYIVLMWAFTYDLNPYYVNHFIKTDHIHMVGDSVGYTYILELDDDLSLSAQISSIVTPVEQHGSNEGLFKLFVEMHFNIHVLSDNNETDIMRKFKEETVKIIKCMNKDFEIENVKTLLHYKSTYNAVPIVLYESVYSNQWNEMMDWCTTACL